MYKYYLNLDGVVMGGRLPKLLALGGVLLQASVRSRRYYTLLLRSNPLLRQH